MPREALPERHGLGPLVLMVRELEVLSPAVQVEVLSQQLERHHHALGVPAGPASSERRVPSGLIGLCCLPEREVERRALLVVRLDTGPRPQGVERLASE